MTLLLPNVADIEWPHQYTNLLALVLIFVGVYVVLKSLLGTRSAPLAAELATFALLSWFLLRNSLSKLDVLRGVLILLPILTVALFQPKIRQAFFSIRNRGLLRHRGQIGEDVYDEIVLAAITLASTKTGALIVIERGVVLREVVNRGVRLDAEVSYDLLVSIFNPAAPMHDGAVIVRGDRIAAAACFTQITLNPRISRDLGTRHRAAIGISEDTDAVVVVVSEETGLISFAQAGQIRRGLNSSTLRAAIVNAFEIRGRREAAAYFNAHPR